TGRERSDSSSTLITTGEVSPPRQPNPCSRWDLTPLDGTGSSVPATPAITHLRGSWSGSGCARKRASCTTRSSRDNGQTSSCTPSSIMSGGQEAFGRASFVGWLISSHSPLPHPAHASESAAGLGHVVAAQVREVDPDPHDGACRRVAEPLRRRNPPGTWLHLLRVASPLPRPAAASLGRRLSAGTGRAQQREV